MCCVVEDVVCVSTLFWFCLRMRFPCTLCGISWSGSHSTVRQSPSMLHAHPWLGLHHSKYPSPMTLEAVPGVLRRLVLAGCSRMATHLAVLAVVLSPCGVVCAVPQIMSTGHTTRFSVRPLHCAARAVRLDAFSGPSVQKWPRYRRSSDPLALRARWPHLAPEALLSCGEFESEVQIDAARLLGGAAAPPSRLATLAGAGCRLGADARMQPSCPMQVAWQVTRRRGNAATTHCACARAQRARLAQR